jgi:hypothetical protein
VRVTEARQSVVLLDGRGLEKACAAVGDGLVRRRFYSLTTTQKNS